MKKLTRVERVFRIIAITCGCMLAGPCGITSLQTQDFLVSTTIRTLVNAATAVVEAALLESAP